MIWIRVEAFYTGQQDHEMFNITWLANLKLMVLCSRFMEHELISVATRGFGF